MAGTPIGFNFGGGPPADFANLTPTGIPGQFKPTNWQTGVSAPVSSVSSLTTAPGAAWGFGPKPEGWRPGLTGIRGPDGNLLPATPGMPMAPLAPGMPTDPNAAAWIANQSRGGQGAGGSQYDPAAMYNQRPNQGLPGLNTGGVNPYLTDPLMAGYRGQQNPLYMNQNPQDFYGDPELFGGGY